MDGRQSEDNLTFCNVSVKELRYILILCSTDGSVCAFLCAVAIAAMIFFRLFTLLTHRLLLYMLIAVMCYSSLVAIQLLALWRDYLLNKEYANDCIAEGFLLMYFAWVMLLATLMVTLHLTSMVLFPSLFQKLTKMEPFYLLFPWIFPLFIVWIPFVHSNYGISGSWCWIRLYNEDCTQNKEGVIEEYAVWYGELIVGLVFNNIALLAIA
ncbi:PREDICTED: cyclic AMP receptor-like protein A, partial [Amphimedon queenslandica]|uniref:G-protein coupled receptors family 2 profile 2 domain-containing protein n=1 Tax=Amphimedon queenslandica TaxID=400682 RepID=A0AAN0ISC4_AMPQE